MSVCIICWKDSNSFSDEHVIPESLGGYYHIRCVCRDCNSRLGSQVDSKLVNHTFSKFGRYIENIVGKSKNIPNPFSGTHTLADDETQKVRLEVDDSGIFQPHLIPKVECNFDPSSQELKLDIVMPPEQKNKILDKVEERYGVKIDRQDLSVTSKPVTVNAGLKVDTLQFKIGLLKMAYEFAYSVFPQYRSDPSVKVISSILKNADYEAAEKYANIGNGFDRAILEPISEIVDFQKGNHYLVLIPSNEGLICFVHLYNMFSIGVTLSTDAYPSDMTLGVNDFRAKKFSLYNAEEIANTVFGSPDIRLQYFFDTEKDCAEFVEIQKNEQFEVFSEAGDYPLYDIDGSELGSTICAKVAELVPMHEMGMDCRIQDVVLQDEVYVRINPFGTYVRVSGVRLEYPPRSRL